jgi:hypothetical protein
MAEPEKKRSIFREKAMAKLAAPEEVDKLLVVMTPMGWLAVSCLFALIIATLIWSFVGQIPVTVHGKGIILTSRGVFTVTSPVSGIVTKVGVKSNDWVTPDSLVLEMQQKQKDQKDLERVFSREKGKILEVYVNEGDWVQAGDVIAWAQYPIEEGDEYICYAFYSVAEGEKIAPDMEAKIGLENVDIAKVGYLLGKVESVSQFPVTERSMLNHIRNQDIIALLKAGQPSVIRAIISLKKDEKSPSGYLWTTKDVSPGYITAGTIADVTITTETKRPITYLLPILAKNPKRPLTTNPDRFPGGK